MSPKYDEPDQDWTSRAAPALPTVTEIDERSIELVALTDRVMAEWQIAAPYLSKKEYRALYEEHVMVGRDVLMLAAILLGQLWLAPENGAVFAALQAQTKTLGAFVENALVVCEAIAHKGATEK